MGKKCFGRYFYAFLIFFFLIGCRKEYKNDINILAIDPQAEMISVPKDYLVDSIEAVGGLENWGIITQLVFDCMVTFYQSDGSFYLTEQHYDIYPWSNSIQIYGEEPQGRYVWQLSHGQFKVLKDNERIRNSIVNINNSCLAEAILNIITIPARFLDNSADFTRGSAPIIVNGELHYPVARQSRDANENSFNEFNAIFYQDTNNYLVDIVWLVCQDGDGFIMGQGYDYITINNKNISIPSRIEIFKTDAHGMSQSKLFKIEINST